MPTNTGMDIENGRDHAVAMGIAVPFPTELPEGYAWLDDEPEFDPAVHLQLEAPSEIVMLADAVVAELERATEDAQRAVEEMRAGERQMEHYGG